MGFLTVQTSMRLRRRLTRMIGKSLLVGWWVLAGHGGFGQIRYGSISSIRLPLDTVRVHLIAVQDSIVNDTLFQIVSKEGYPTAYYRKIKTSVCFDNLCRLLNTTLFWNPTGRYMGFELPQGEFLSKGEHKPFTPAEYQRLDSLLGNPFSPLSTMAYSELAPTVKLTSEQSKVDGVSSATAKNVLEYVVEGAAYTTYKMWHVLYGKTQETVRQLTIRELSPDFLLILLDSHDGTDKLWGLNQSRRIVSPTAELERKILTFINEANYNLAERAIYALAPEVPGKIWQVDLAQKLNTTGYAIRKLILQKFTEVPQLDVQAKGLLVNSLKILNGDLIGLLLDVFRRHHLTDDQTSRLVSELLLQSNNFVGRKAFAYLEQIPVRDELVQKRLTEYRQKNNIKL